MLNALPFTDQPRADDRFQVSADAALLAVATIEFITEGFQPLHGFRFQAAISQFLDAVRQTTFQIPAIERRRFAAEQVAPLLLQVWRRRGPERGHAGGNGIGHVFSVLIGVA